MATESPEIYILKKKKDLFAENLTWNDSIADALLRLDKLKPEKCKQLKLVDSNEKRYKVILDAFKARKEIGDVSSLAVILADTNPFIAEELQIELSALDPQYKITKSVLFDTVTWLQEMVTDESGEPWLKKEQMKTITMMIATRVHVTNKIYEIRIEQLRKKVSEENSKKAELELSAVRMAKASYKFCKKLEAMVKKKEELDDEEELAASESSNDLQMAESRGISTKSGVDGAQSKEGIPTTSKPKNSGAKPKNAAIQNETKQKGNNSNNKDIKQNDEPNKEDKSDSKGTTNSTKNKEDTADSKDEEQQSNRTRPRPKTARKYREHYVKPVPNISEVSDFFKILAEQVDHLLGIADEHCEEISEIEKTSLRVRDKFKDVVNKQMNLSKTISVIMDKKSYDESQKNLKVKKMDTEISKLEKDKKRKEDERKKAINKEKARLQDEVDIEKDMLSKLKEKKSKLRDQVEKVKNEIEEVKLKIEAMEASPSMKKILKG